jgi:hypothetical protein
VPIARDQTAEKKVVELVEKTEQRDTLERTASAVLALKPREHSDSTWTSTAEPPYPSAALLLVSAATTSRCSGWEGTMRKVRRVPGVSRVRNRSKEEEQESAAAQVDILVREDTDEPLLLSEGKRPPDHDREGSPFGFERLVGRVKRKLDPCALRGSAQSRPPCRSIISRLI